MSESKEVSTAVHEAPAPEERMPIDDFCLLASSRGATPEELAVLQYREKAAGRHHDTHGSYQSRLAGLHRSPTSK